MRKNDPSRTAMRVAMRRAAHQILDDPRVFCDPLALSVVGEENVRALRTDPQWSERTSMSLGIRALLAARSRYAEDELHRAVGRGVRQYVILGAGLDTFAYRQPYPENALRVFEVDHPATQHWKYLRLKGAGIQAPRTLSFVPVDFETETLEDGLRRADGFDASRSTFFSWLGVTQYITDSAVMATLQFVAAMPAGSAIVFDYTVSPSLLSQKAREAFDRLAHRVATAGEPFRTFFDPADLADELRSMGFTQIEDLGPDELNARYFQGRTDDLRVRGFTRIMHARV
ncbi:MAG TPA: class I SAM-dependent methyltransferase [Deltaproteobacteria bacterium]|nr:class I SAM-dependent methyltransferase [Deltaproteobacteria bacterium]HPR53885.1 class I SAM-dependent methyltransferase [Deltaproteobacteria bacterium]HXK46685.1 class I SAM-dependent methyltransferase [Deltaproteobacteria bacterium]